VPYTALASELKILLEDLRRHLDWQASDGRTSLPLKPKDKAPPAPMLGGATTLGRSQPVPTRDPAESAVPLDRAQQTQARSPARAASPARAPSAAKSDVLQSALPLAGMPAPQTAIERSSVPEAIPEERRSLEEVRNDLGDCTRCKLCSGRTHIVFGVGNPKAELVFVGEGPGADEDEQGIPFVGKAGQLLTKMIEAMGFSRDEVYICNVVKCRPPNNRNPEPDEIEACSPFLRAQLASIRPKVIVTLGKCAAQSLLGDGTPITRLRGNWREYGGIPVMPTFHPAYLLRSPAEKKNAWADLRQVIKRLGKPSDRE
jgi:DNA polymerase